MGAEKNFEKRIKNFLKSEGCYFIKYWGGGIYTKSGIPDLLVCCNGYFVGVELKAENGEPSDLQLYNVRQIEKAGGYGWVLYPEGFEDFKDFVLLVKSGMAEFAEGQIYQEKKGWKNERL